MSTNFNLNRPPIDDEEIRKGQDFDALVKAFKEQSLKKAQGDESWWKNKKITYSTVIAGLTVICTITYLSISKSTKTNSTQKHDTKSTLVTQNQPSVKKAFIQAPSAQLRTAYSKYTIKAEKGASILHNNGSRILVPKNALVDKSGKQLVGDVTIEYKEMKDMGDVICNGIPMKYDSAGKDYVLETAGMFDIRASRDGEVVFVKPGKELTVHFASLNSEDRFNQYYLDTVQGNWVYLRRDDLPRRTSQPSTSSIPAPPSPKAVSLQNQIGSVIPKQIDSVTKVYQRAVKKLPAAPLPLKPEAATGKRPEFVIDADLKDFPELAAYENTLFEVGDENKNYSKNMHEITWNDVKLLPGPQNGINYILQLRYRSQTEELVVYPVLKGKDYENALQKYQAQFRNYERLQAEKQEKEKQLYSELQAKQEAYLAKQAQLKKELEAEQIRLKIEMERNRQQQLTSGFASASNSVKVERVFRINRFGVFNSDCPHPSPSDKRIKPLFVLKNKGNLLIPQYVYLINHSSKTVTSYAASEVVPLNSGDKYSFCLFRNGSVFVNKSEEFEQVMESGKKEFPVLAIQGAEEDPEKFKKALGL